MSSGTPFLCQMADFCGFRSSVTAAFPISFPAPFCGAEIDG
jgi:hypothetical protein